MSSTTIPLSPKRQQWFRSGLIALLSVLFFTSTAALNLDLATFLQRGKIAGRILRKFMVLDIAALPEILPQLGVSLALAVAGLTIGWILSLFLAFLGAANTAPLPLFSGVIKGLVSLVRAVPSLIWILIVVASLGFGNTAAVIGMIFPTTGYLTKSFIASIEEQEPAIIETLQAAGASWGQIIWHGLLPGLKNPFLSWTAIRLESNIAESISLGMVGAGGIGALLTKAIGKYDYGRISTIILVIFLTMVTMELLVGRLKKSSR